MVKCKSFHLGCVINMAHVSNEAHHGEPLCYGLNILVCEKVNSGGISIKLRKEKVRYWRRAVG